MNDMETSASRPENTSEAREQWCFDHPEDVFRTHLDGLYFIAIHPEHGIVISAEDYETFEAKINDRRPSIVRALFKTCTSLWVHTVQA